MNIVVIDNYDSFTYNLVHLVKELGAQVTVFRNDQFEMKELELHYSVRYADIPHSGHKAPAFRRRRSAARDPATERGCKARGSG